MQAPTANHHMAVWQYGKKKKVLAIIASQVATMDNRPDPATANKKNAAESEVKS